MEIFCGSKARHDIFPHLSRDQECGRWVQHWIMISGLVFFSSYCCFGLGVPVRREVYSPCLSRVCSVEGLQELKSHRVRGRLLVLWALSSQHEIQCGGREVRAGGPAWDRAFVTPCRTAYDSSKKKKVFFRKILKTPPRPPPVARCSERGGPPVNGDIKAGQAKPL